MTDMASDDFEMPKITFVQYFNCEDDEQKSTASAFVRRRFGLHWVTAFWVSKDLRGHGLGTELMRRILTEFGHLDLYLHVEPYANNPMGEDELMAWYSKFGFKPIEPAGTMVRPGWPQPVKESAREAAMAAAITKGLDGCQFCRQGICRADAHNWLREARDEARMPQ